MIDQLIFQLKFALRILFNKSRLTSTINVGGLTAGFLTVLITALYTWDEMSYDRFHPDVENLYRIVVNWDGDGVTRNWARSSNPIGEQIQAYVPEIEAVARIRKNPGTDLLKVGEQYFFEPDLLIVEPNFFEVFGFKLKTGDLQTVLEDKYSVVLTESAAAKYFGAQNPIGKVIEYDNKYSLTVTGIAQDPPTNSHLLFNSLLSFTLLQEMFNERRRTHWGQFDLYTFARINGSADLNEVIEKSKGFLKQVAPEWVPEKMTLGYQPIASIHLGSDRHSELGINSDPMYSAIFISAALLILIVALVNHINLSMATYLRRQKEITMRKVLGSSKIELILSLITESMLVALFAMLLALALSWFLIPGLSQNVGKNLWPGDPALFIVSAVALSGFVGIVAGILPSLHLAASVNTVTKQKMVAQRKFSRNAMIMVQIAISTLLIIGILAVNNQLQFLYNTHLGFDGRNVLVTPIKDRSKNAEYQTTIERLKRIPGVEAASLSSTTPGSNNALTYTFTFEGGGRGETPMSVVISDENYSSLYNLKLVTGRYADGKAAAEGNEIMINQAAVELLQLGEPIGAAVTGKVKGTVVGVVEDFQLNSLHLPVEPVIIYNYLPTLRFLSVKLGHDYGEQTIKQISETWSTIYPNYPIEYKFLTEENKELYWFENGVRLSLAFMVPIAMIVALSGLIGYTLLLAEEKAFEFSIKKVLGGSNSDILKQTLRRLVPAAFAGAVIVALLGYWGLLRWLEDFAYRIDMNLGIFIWPSLGMISATVILISILLIGQLNQKPIQYLRQHE
ncbi:MAG: ABC transporter permease [Cyclobacteriaceae bacterium]